MPSLADSFDSRDYIITFKQLLSSDTCNTLMSWLKTLPEATDPWDGWAPAEAATGHDTNSITQHRTCDFTMLNEHRAPNYNSIHMALNHVNEQYPYQHQSHSITGIQVIRYKPGHKFLEHVDHYSGAPRTLSISVLLNDDYAGGRMSFYQSRHSVDAFCSAGDAIVFPANLCFPHQIEPVTQGERYSMVIWTQ